MATYFPTWSDSSLGRPRARAACRPAFVRSRIRSRSNFAREANTLKMNRPCELVVSIGLLRLFRATPLSMSPYGSDTRCLSDHPSRSSFHMTITSPPRTTSSNRAAGSGSAPGSIHGHSRTASMQSVRETPLRGDTLYFDFADGFCGRQLNGQIWLYSGRSRAVRKNDRFCEPMSVSGSTNGVTGSGPIRQSGRAGAAEWNYTLTPMPFTSDGIGGLEPGQGYSSFLDARGPE